MSAELSNNSLINKKVIFEANAFRRVPIHLGAKIDFLPDGTLLLTSGDGFDYKEQAQSLNNHFGKIIRLNKDGSVPSDNPFVDIPNALPEIFSYGHRNMQGLVVMEDGRIFEKIKFGKVEYDNSLYHSSATSILNIITNYSEGYQSVMILSLIHI